MAYKEGLNAAENCCTVIIVLLAAVAHIMLISPMMLTWRPLYLVAISFSTCRCMQRVCCRSASRRGSSSPSSPTAMRRRLADSRLDKTILSAWISVWRSESRSRSTYLTKELHFHFTYSLTAGVTYSKSYRQSTHLITQEDQHHCTQWIKQPVGKQLTVFISC